MTGTPMYMSPEVIKGEKPDHFGAVDIWSLGCVILEMATGHGFVGLGADQVLD